MKPRGRRRAGGIAPRSGPGFWRKGGVGFTFTRSTRARRRGRFVGIWGGAEKWSEQSSVRLRGREYLNRRSRRAQSRQLLRSLRDLLFKSACRPLSRTEDCADHLHPAPLI